MNRPSQGDPLIASELRLIREELSGLQDSLSQIVSKSMFVSPEFLFSELQPITEEEVWEVAGPLLGEFGADYVSGLRKLHKYSESYFLDSLFGETGNGGLKDRLRNLELAIQCEQNHTPFQLFLFRLYQREFRKLNEASLDAFQGLYANAELIVLHLSCRARMSSANESAITFVDAHSRIKNLIVVGHAAGKAGSYSLIPTDGLLVVPANDAYEGLAEKSAAAYAFLAFSGIKACILKVDDDIRCIDLGQLLQGTLRLVRSHDYVGRVWHAKYGCSRSWHFDKCRDPELSARPYGLLVNTSYAEGPAYFLSPRAVHLVGKASVYVARLFETEWSYEDIGIGKVLNHYGIMPLNYDPIRNGLLASTDAWMMERAGLSPLGSGSGQKKSSSAQSR
jgi:hypothetical protein